MIRSAKFIPMSIREAKRQGFSEFDIILISGDAYVDHPLFCTAVIARLLENLGYRVGIISQPDWRSSKDFGKLGRPRLLFGITSGNTDSMVNNYTARRMKRHNDVYSPRGIPKRPDRAVIVYTQRVHALYPDVPIIIGGLEASLRRFAHYDYWSDSVRKSILADAPADILVFGMGELQISEIAGRLDRGENVEEIRDVPGTTISIGLKEWGSGREKNYIQIPGYPEVSENKRAYAEAFALHYQEQDPIRGKAVIQMHPKVVVIQNRPARPLTTNELDHIYELPYSRLSHPLYAQPVPALEPVKFSIVSHRGCFGGCAFCALVHHQGRIIQSRSIESVVGEVTHLTKMSDFKGIIQDIGGPTANMYGIWCKQWKEKGTCPDRCCSTSCQNLDVSHQKQIELLQRVRRIPKVKRVFISSGIRHDLILRDRSPYLQEICCHHISGHLKVAPEHIVKHVTDYMNKPGKKTFEDFKKKFNHVNESIGKKQFLLPYFMSGHPGCTIEDMIELALYLKKHHLYTQQVQDFTPTPMTLSTTMYFTGINPFTMEKVYVPKGREKQIQRAILHFKEQKNYQLILEGLLRVGRQDLVGFKQECLIPPKEMDTCRIN